MELNWESQTHRRSQDFWLGGAKPLKNSAVFTEIESEFWVEIGNSNDFSAQIQVISKKKKRSSPKFEQFFRPNSGDLQKKKKKRPSPKFEQFFRPNSGDLQKKKKKKKKGLHRNQKCFFDRNRKF